MSILANFYGILATVLASIQYFPQLYTTYQLKAVGSLSIPMMLIQTPGSFLWAASLAARYGPEGWSAWGVYLVTGCLQGSLLGLGIYYEILARRRRKGTESRGNGPNFSTRSNNETDDEGGHVVEGDEEDHERTALLRNER